MRDLKWICYVGPKVNDGHWSRRQFDNLKFQAGITIEETQADGVNHQSFVDKAEGQLKKKKIFF